MGTATAEYVKVVVNGVDVPAGDTTWVSATKVTFLAPKGVGTGNNVEVSPLIMRVIVDCVGLRCVIFCCVLCCIFVFLYYFIDQNSYILDLMHHWQSQATKKALLTKVVLVFFFRIAYKCI